MTFQSYVESFRGETFFYGNATSALRDYLTAKKRNAGYKKFNFLLPSFICANVYSAILSLDIDVVFYDVDEHCRVDLHEIERLANRDTLGFLWVHYFGRTHRTAAARSLADTLGILMVEDCAHTVNAVADGKELGSYGHVAIFSLWKTLRTADGALLVLNKDKEFTPLYRTASSNLRAAKDLALKGVKRAYVAIFDKPISQRAAQLPPPFLVDVKKMQDDGVQAISTVSKMRILGMDVDRVSSIRRQNFLLWQNSVGEFPFMNPMFENLQDGDTPFSFPVFAQEGKRDEIRSKLAENGILCGVGFPEAPFEKGFTAARKLAENILELPVHQAFTRQEFDHACKTLRTWNRSS